MQFVVYLAGEIHSDWRDEIKQKQRRWTCRLRLSMENHERSDNIGEEIMGVQPDSVLKDARASDINNFRTEVLMEKADFVIALFGEKYKQWNTAMDASYAIAKGKPLILIRPKELHHPLKELFGKANITVETVNQAMKALSYLFETE